MSESRERTFLVGIFGDNFEHRKFLGQALGAPGTSSDIQFYNRLDSQQGEVFTALTPIDYPEKLKPFLQTLILTNIHILIIDVETGLNATVGEILVGLDMFHRISTTRVLISLNGIKSNSEWKLLQIKEKIQSLLSNTSLRGIDFIEIRRKEDYDLIKKKIVDLGNEIYEDNSTKSDYTKILIDHAFSVKGIGTVILGIIKKGSVRSNQMLELIGNGGVSKKVIIRGIQKYDRNFKEAHEGDRVGLALKGNISVNEINRDNLITTQGSFKGEKEIKAKVYVNQFYKPKTGTISPKDSIQYHGIVEIKSSPLKVIDGDEILPGNSGILTLKFDKPLFHNGSGLRGILCDLNKFENKLRIIGHFEQVLV
ncbi:MAG: EF-Tu/IF-2/RF-3 family GTPase [Promethearchaeota archaeon]